MHLIGKFAAFGLILMGLAACQPGGVGGIEGEGGGSMLTTILPLILIFAVFYFLIIRPQQRKQKAHRQMIAEVRRGDQIVTGGGIVGNVVRIDRDNNLQVEIAPDLRVKVMRDTVSEVLARPTPIGGEDDPYEDEDEDEEYEEGEYEEEEEEEAEEDKGDKARRLKHGGKRRR